MGEIGDFDDADLDDAFERIAEQGYGLQDLESGFCDLFPVWRFRQQSLLLPNKFQRAMDLFHYSLLTYLANQLYLERLCASSFL